MSENSYKKLNITKSDIHTTARVTVYSLLINIKAIALMAKWYYKKHCLSIYYMKLSY